MLSLTDRRWLCKLAAMTIRGIGEVICSDFKTMVAVRHAQNIKRLADLYDDPEEISDLGYPPPKKAEDQP